TETHCSYLAASAAPPRKCYTHTHVRKYTNTHTHTHTHTHTMSMKTWDSVSPYRRYKKCCTHTLIHLPDRWVSVYVCMYVCMCVCVCVCVCVWLGVRERWRVRIAYSHGCK